MFSAQEEMPICFPDPCCLVHCGGLCLVGIDFFGLLVMFRFGCVACMEFRMWISLNLSRWLYANMILSCYLGRFRGQLQRKLSFFCKAQVAPLRITSTINARISKI